MLWSVPAGWAGDPAPDPWRADTITIERQDDENGCVEGRVRNYLDRHGVDGRIDAETQLYVTREFKELLDRDRRTIKPAAIAGDVWRNIGPTKGAGRATAVAIHPTVPGTAIIGAAGGGAWRTTDSGVTWQPLTETVADLSVGAVAYAPSDGTKVYLGTGEGGDAGDFIPGIGLLHSTDGGTNWLLPESVIATQFFRLSVNPNDANDVVAATNLGVMRSRGGQAGPWTTTLPFASTGRGVSPGYGPVTDLLRDPSNPDTLYATTYDRGDWCVRYACTDPHIYKSPRIVKSTDGGSSWTEVMGGLPLSTISTYVDRIGIAIAPSSPSTLYAALATFDQSGGATVGHVYKTTDGGASWSETSLHTSARKGYLGTQAWYANTIVVSPSDPNRVYVGGVSYAATADGGATWDHAFDAVHADCHDMRFDASGTLWIASDGGIWTAAATGGVPIPIERNANLVTRQFYTVATDPASTDRVFGGQQDNGTIRRSGTSDWATVLGSDGFDCPINPDASSVVFGTVQNSKIRRSSNGADVSPLYISRQPIWPGGELLPFATMAVLDPNTPSTMYTASYRVWKSTTAGDAWTPLSTTTTDGSAWLTTRVVTAFAVARGNSQVLMVGKGGLLFYSSDGGMKWANGIGLPGRYINAIQIDPNNPAVAFLALGGLASPSVYETTDGGASWTGRSAGLPAFSTMCLTFDPTDSATLYAGTDVGVYRSSDGGANWSRFGTGMPAVSVYAIEILRDGNTVRAATHGRGMWELVTPAPVNHAPRVSVASAPAGAPLTVVRGAQVTFNGTFSDEDGDHLSAKWIFPDDFTAQAATSGASVGHTFYRTGRFPITLTARDPHGAVGSSAVDVVVADPSDSCATPAVIPAAGPFPYTVAFNNESSSIQPSDPIGGTATGGCNFTLYKVSNWFSFTPPVGEPSHSYSITLCGSRGSLVLAIYTASSSCGPYVLVGGGCLQRDGGSYGEDNFTCTGDTSVTAPLVAGKTYFIEVTNFANLDYGANALTIAPAGALFSPVAVDVSPAIGGTGGGQTLTISGSGFVTGASVSLGGVAAFDVTVINSNLITCVAPPHAAGPVEVSVTSGARSTLGNAYTYVAPPVGSHRRAVAP